MLESITVSPSATTTYTLMGLSSTTTGCTNTVVLTVTVNPLPVLQAASFPTVLCQGGTGTITATGAVSYTWSPGSSSGNIVVATPVSTTIYTVAGVSAHGCYNTGTVAMNVNTNQLIMSADTAVCKGSPAYLRSDGAVSYSWTNGAPFQNITVYPVSNTVYSVGALDAHNCPLGGTVSVVVNPLPVITVGASNLIVCRGEALQIFAGGASTYKWSNGATGGTITPSTQFDLPLTYTVTGTDTKGCSSTATITAVVSACTSIKEEQHTAMFRLMPNPASTEVNIESPVEGSWRIADLAGRIVLDGNMQAGNQSVNISTLPAGIYLVRLQTQDSDRTVRLIKE